MEIKSVGRDTCPQHGMITCVMKVDEITEEREWLVLILSQGASTFIKTIEGKCSIKGARIV